MNALIDRSNLQRVVAIINGKGGVGKTTLTANIGGLLASSGWRVLLVDLDYQGNLGLDLGYHGTAVDDEGMELSKTIVYASETPKPVRNIRPNLDVLIGGRHLEHASAALASRAAQGHVSESRLAVAQLLTKVADDYDIVIMDCPPSNDSFQSAAVTAARHILIPVRTDAGSLSGLRITADRLSTVLDLNPDVDLLGVVLCDSATSETRVRKDFSVQVHDALGVPDGAVFTRFLRHAGATANSARRKGVLVHELETEVRNAPKWYDLLRAGESQIRTGPQSAGGVAGDLQAITAEVIARITASEKDAAHA